MGAKLYIGAIIGRLTIMKRTDMSKRSRWLVQCSCGTEKEVAGSSLLSGATKSCGCLRSELVASKNTKHGGSKDQLYKVWLMMWDRCSNPRNPHYKNYGGRGIKVIQRWSDYSTFKMDVGDRPSSAHSLERKNNDGDYSKRNVVWATRSEQSRNTRRNMLVVYKGRRQCLKDWANELGVSYFTLIDRIKVQGMTPKEAFETPIGRWKVDSK